ncbi:MAG: hypothetical protein NZ554_07590, partial [Bryobacteraceae bacterium]|nr:hypothetical protein [Bryobacteraceae bacterium]
RYIAGINPEIPYALLAFQPHFHMADLPRVPARWAGDAEAAARSAGLRNVRIGNLHLLVRRELPGVPASVPQAPEDGSRLSGQSLV